MAEPTIQNGANIPLNERAGYVPDVSGALQNYYQPMNFNIVTKTIQAFMAEETEEVTNFRGVIQPFSARQLALKPEGERSWTWLSLHSDRVLPLETDNVVVWQGEQTRVMGLKNYKLYGYLEYELVQDWEGAGPN